MGIATNTQRGDRNEQIAEIRVSDGSVLTMPYGCGVKAPRIIAEVCAQRSAGNRYF